MKKLYIHSILCLFVTVTMHVHASQFQSELPEIAPAKDEPKQNAIVKKSKSVDSALKQGISKKTVSFHSHFMVKKFKKHINDENKDEHFFSTTEEQKALRDSISEFGMPQQKWTEYEYARKEGYRLKIKGMNYDALEIAYNNLQEKYRSLEMSHEKLEPEDKEYASLKARHALLGQRFVALSKENEENKTDVSMYQTIALALGSGLVATTGYIIFEWMKQKNANQSM